jgi:hypothetical protein
LGSSVGWGEAEEAISVAGDSPVAIAVAVAGRATFSGGRGAEGEAALQAERTTDKRTIKRFLLIRALL